ncbi:MAG TPA: hypothetical protein VFS43_45925 [Polyangiaceae bacterium]|nr:hypothetical protein [Polyangiaceae bacterium]
MALRSKLADYRLDFFGDMNGDALFNYEDVVNPQGGLIDGDHAWRVRNLGPDNNQFKRRRGTNVLEIHYLHNYEFEDLSQPALKPAGGNATIELTGLEEFQNKRLQVRISTLDGDTLHTVGIFRVGRVRSTEITGELAGIIIESQPYQIEVYVDGNGNRRYDNPAEAEGGDFGWYFEATAVNNQLRVAFNPQNAGPRNVSVGEP